jgi:heme exporter protein C
MTGRPPHLLWLVVTAVAVIVGTYMALLWAPTEQTMGHVQRIFYYHVASAWVAFLAFFFVFLYSFVYLLRGNRVWDIRAAACAEVGILFCSLVLITGPIWATPVWGYPWAWDARLTLTLVLWLIYVAYLMLRHYVTDPQRRATFSAVLGIVGFVDVPLVYFSIRWWRTQHPQPVIAGGDESGLDPQMWAALLACFGAFLLLFFYWTKFRAGLQRMEDELIVLRNRAEEKK